MNDPKRVLIVDDDAGIRQILELALAEEGYAVASATDGESALASIGSFDPDVILMDLKMPGMDGWQFLRQYSLSGERRARVIVLTAASDADQNADMSVADGALAKPFDLTDLFALVERLAG